MHATDVEGSSGGESPWGSGMVTLLGRRGSGAEEDVASDGREERPAHGIVFMGGSRAPAAT